MAVGDDHPPATQAGLVPLDLSRSEVQAAQPPLADAVQVSLVEHRRREVVLHRLLVPHRLRVALLLQTEDGPAGPVVGGDEDVAVGIQRRRDVDEGAGLPGEAPQSVAVRRRHTNRTRTREEDDLASAADLGPDRATLADRVVQRLPDDAAVLLVQGGDRLALGSAGLDIDAFAHDEGAAAVAVPGAVAFGELEKVLLPDLLPRFRLQAQQDPCRAQGVDAAGVNRWRRARAGPRGRHASAREGLVRGVVAGVAVAPDILAGGGIEADDDLLVLLLGLREHEAIGHGQRREAAGQRGLPQLPGTLLGPFLEQALLPRDAVQARPAPARPVLGPRARPWTRRDECQRGTSKPDSSAKPEGHGLSPAEDDLGEGDGASLLGAPARSNCGGGNAQRSDYLSKKSRDISGPRPGSKRKSKECSNLRSLSR